MRAFKIVGGIFFGLGLLFLVLSAFLFVQQRTFLASTTTASGQVIDMQVSQAASGISRGRSAYAVVQFKDDRGVSHEFIDSVGSTPPRFAIGQRVAVRFPAANPAAAFVDDFLSRWLVVSITGLLGSIFSVVGGSVLAISLVLDSKKRKLKEGGTLAWADFVEMRVDASLTINDRSALRVVAKGQNPITGQRETFESEPIWTDLTDELTGRQLQVFVDPKQPSRHLINLESYLSGRNP